ncbi:hypothetical protein G7046_g8426 [Stylonectria norvegica]|nr:hypothetical protein G7046_g8426 [Stylonectria norvegica]
MATRERRSSKKRLYLEHPEPDYATVRTRITRFIFSFQQGWPGRVHHGSASGAALGAAKAVGSGARFIFSFQQGWPGRVHHGSASGWGAAKAPVTRTARAATVNFMLQAWDVGQVGVVEVT